MEKSYKKFVSISTQSLNSVLSTFKILVQSRFGIKVPKAIGEKCFVIANGPSLKHTIANHADLLKKNPLICVNTFAVTDEFIKLKPMYYVMLDPFMWEIKNETNLKTFKNLEEQTSWTLYLLIPKHAINQTVCLDLQRKNKNIILTPFNYTVFKGFPKIAHWFYQKNLAMPQSLNVTITALFLGINMGYKKVHLIGADHTWHEHLHMSENNLLHTKVPHFYENEMEIKYVPFYKSGKPELGTQKAHEFFDIWSRTFYGYMLINDYANTQNCTVFNSSEVSFIDAFKRFPL